MKASSSDEISDNLLLIASGMFFIMQGGWLDSLWTKSGVVAGFNHHKYKVNVKEVITHVKQVFILLLSLFLYYVSKLFVLGFCFTKPTRWQSVACSTSCYHTRYKVFVFVFVFFLFLIFT